MKYNFISREGGTGEALKHVLHLILGRGTYFNVMRILSRRVQIHSDVFLEQKLHGFLILSKFLIVLIIAHRQNNVRNF